MQMSLKIDSKGSIDIKSSLVQVMARHQTADKPLPVQSNPVISRAVNSRKSVSRACTLDPKF